MAEPEGGFSTENSDLRLVVWYNCRDCIGIQATGTNCRDCIGIQATMAQKDTKKTYVIQ